MPVNYAHIVEVPTWDYMIRLVQLVTSLVLLGLTGYSVAFSPEYGQIILSVVASAWSVVLLGYYLIAVHVLPFIYNWIAVLFTEVVTVCLWAATFASVAALYAMNRDDGNIYINVTIAIFSLSIFAFLLQVVTLALVVIGVQKHRKAGKPLFSPQGEQAQFKLTAKTSQV